MKYLKTLLNSSVIRFAVVGCINTLVGFAIMFGMYNLGRFSYWISSAANYILTSILSFFLNKFFTFRNHSSDPKQVVRFIVNIAVCYLLAYGAAKPLVAWLLNDAAIVVRDNVSMLTGAVLFTACNYLGQRFFAFKEN